MTGVKNYNFYSKELNFIKNLEKASPDSKTFKNEIIFHSNKCNNTFKPMRRILTFFGRWPLQPESKIVSKSQNKNGTAFKIEYYTGSFKSPIWIYFSFTTLLLLASLVLSIVGFCDFFMEWNLIPKSDWDLEQKKNFETNIVPFVLIWSCLLHCSISSVSFFTNRKKVAKLFNYWNVVIDQLELEIPKEIKRFIWTSNLGFLIFVFCLGFLGYSILKLSIVRGAGLLIGIVIVRPFIPLLKLNARKDLGKIGIFGACICSYAVYSSRTFLILFRYKCKLLNHAFKVWNGRFKKFLQSPSISSTDGNIVEKLVCEKLMRDQAILLKLVRLTDTVFGSVLQSYYASQLLNMCFELYYLARSGSSVVGSSDIIAAVLILSQNIYIFFELSLEASSLSEEAMKGLEIVRAHWVSPDDSIYRKYLMSNMQAVFSQKIVLTGKKYFSLDRPFIITMLGSVFTYFIIILQVGPSLHKQMEVELELEASSV